jgi:hypothetical protein
MTHHVRSARPSPRALLSLLITLIPLGLLGAGSATQSPPALHGDLPLSSLPESADLRAADREAFLAAPIATLAKSPALLRENPWGTWKRQVISNGGWLYQVYSPARNGEWPIYGQGTWILKRNRNSGAFDQAKIFLKSDPGTFIRLYPDGDRTRMDLVVYGGVLNQGIPLPWPFARSLVVPVREILAATGETVDWALLEPEPADYRTMAELAASIRSRLPGLRYLDDGGLDEEGRLVFIATGAEQPEKKSGLNCSGFAQWVVDGLLKPLSGRWLGSEELKTKRLDTRVSTASARFEDSLDPYFGLDWTRNLGLAAREVLERPRKSAGVVAAILASDVNEVPFALIASGSSPVNGGREYDPFRPYAEDAGFASEGLPSLLWWLAMKEPGYLYLASISSQDRAGLRHHYHVSVLLPWFDEGGAFHVDVFESAAETSLLALTARTKGQMIHLVRVKAASAFDPPLLPVIRLP